MASPDEMGQNRRSLNMPTISPEKSWQKSFMEQPSLDKEVDIPI